MNAPTNNTPPPRPKLPAGHIGYYNAHAYPVIFTSNLGNRGPAELGPGEAVRNAQGELVEYDPDLERQVSDRLLKRIMPGDPKYKEFSKVNARAVKRENTPTISAADASVGPAPAPTSNLVSGVDYTVEDIDGIMYYIHNGRKFASMSALSAYLSTLAKGAIKS